MNNRASGVNGVMPKLENYEYDLAYKNGTIMYVNPVPNGKDC